MTEEHPGLLDTFTTLDKGHGRLEERTVYRSHATNVKFLLPGIQQVALVVRKREELLTGKIQQESLFLISNLDPNKVSAEELLRLKRDYWKVEAELHWRKDMIFGEDRSTIRTKHGPVNMSTLRNFSISTLLARGVKNVKEFVETVLLMSPQEKIDTLFA